MSLITAFLGRVQIFLFMMNISQLLKNTQEKDILIESIS